MRADALFAVMGATADVTIVGGPRALLEVARGRLTDLERRWSRFIPTSEVSRLNRAGGVPVRVSSETRLLVQRALDGHSVTGDRFDPTLLGAILRAGYAESFERLGESRRSDGAAPAARRGRRDELTTAPTVGAGGRLRCRSPPVTSQLWWYTARAGGIVAWALLAASVVWGLLLSTRVRPGGVAPSWILDLHRFLGGLA